MGSDMFWFSQGGTLMKKRILSMLLTIVMVIGMFPTAAFAAEENTEAITVPAEDTVYTVETVTSALEVDLPEEFTPPIILI